MTCMDFDIIVDAALDFVDDHAWNKLYTDVNDGVYGGMVAGQSAPRSAMSEASPAALRRCGAPLARVATGSETTRQNSKRMWPRTR